MKVVQSLPSCIFAAFLGLLSQVALAQTPIQNELLKLLAIDGARLDEFGNSIGIDGDTAVIGASGKDDIGYDSGAAYVFVRDQSGAWIEQAKLIGSDTLSGDGFGRAVAIDGDTIVVGALFKRTARGRSGLAYVFTRGEHGAWSESAQLLASDAGTGDQFGSGLAIDEDTVIVGSRYDTEIPGRYPPGSGSAYVFVRDRAGAWSEQAKLRGSDTNDQLMQAFGGSIDLEGDTAIIGAFRYDWGVGAAYVFTRNGIGQWTEQARLLDPEAEPDAWFGYSVGLYGENVVIGAPLKGDWAGAAYIFGRDGAGAWNLRTKLVGSDGNADDLFGWSVCLEASTAVIGAFGHEAKGDRAGTAYVYRRNAGNWPETTKLLGSDSKRYDRFGSAVSISHGTLIAGAPGDADFGYGSGSVYVFGLVAQVDIDVRPYNRHNRVIPWSSGLLPVAILGSADFDALQVDLATVRFGPSGASPFHRLAWARDVNRDGYTDLLVMFRVRDAGFARGDTEAVLTGSTYDMQAFEGTDSITTPR
jgi:hypothetical protein